MARNAVESTTKTMEQLTTVQSRGHTVHRSMLADLQNVVRPWSMNFNLKERTTNIELAVLDILKHPVVW